MLKIILIYLKFIALPLGIITSMQTKGLNLFFWKPQSNRNIYKKLI